MKRLRNCLKLDIPYFNQGEAYRFGGNNAQAKKMYARTIWINPGHVDAHVNLAGDPVERRKRGRGN